MNFIVYLYFIIGLVDVAADISGRHMLQLVTKPLLMPVLILLYARMVSSFVGKDWFVVAALLFSWGGDVALMLAGGERLYFLLGLVSFLVAHVFYILAFGEVRDMSAPVVLSRRPWLMIPLLAYFMGLVSVVFPALPSDMRVPVAVYTAVICAMVSFALARYRRVGDRSFALVFGGALLFMISDSIIAVNKFVCQGHLPMAGAAIMSTYIVAQYLIVKGMWRNENPA